MQAFIATLKPAVAPSKTEDKMIRAVAVPPFLSLAAKEKNSMARNSPTMEIVITRFLPLISEINPNEGKHKNLTAASAPSASPLINCASSATLQRSLQYLDPLQSPDDRSTSSGVGCPQSIVVRTNTKKTSRLATLTQPSINVGNNKIQIFFKTILRDIFVCSLLSLDVSLSLCSFLSLLKSNSVPCLGTSFAITSSSCIFLPLVAVGDAYSDACLVPPTLIIISQGIHETLRVRLP
mmetsp:Transcript_10777/g.16049  ORF Transcript_10777/g.16049 Transcript_10777/m.16049 type:complete len:237 (-) Transcript_10777:19-729(-)